MKQAQLRVVSALLLVAMAGGQEGSPSRDTGHGLRSDRLQWPAGPLGGEYSALLSRTLLGRGRFVC